MPKIFSRLDGESIEISEAMFAELERLENLTAGQLISQFSTQPVEQTLSSLLSARSSSQQPPSIQLPVESQKPEPPPAPRLDPEPGKDWSDLIG